MGKGGADGNNLRKMNTLGGSDVTWLLSEEVQRQQILQYIYPSEQEMEDANLRITFFGDISGKTGPLSTMAIMRPCAGWMSVGISPGRSAIRSVVTVPGRGLGYPQPDDQVSEVWFWPGG